jgi:hypothetical protein
MEHERNQFAAQDALRSMRANLRQALPREWRICLTPVAVPAR